MGCGCGKKIAKIKQRESQKNKPTKNNLTRRRIIKKVRR